jgi:hypothetical protein
LVVFWEILVEWSTSMLMTGKEYLQSIRDGRVIYIGKERVKDQTTHPAFASGARTYAALFDMKSDPALRDVMTFEEGGERYSMYYLQPRSQEDLRRRNRAHRKTADFCFGLMGRTPRRLRWQSNRTFVEARGVRQRARRPPQQSVGHLPARPAKRPVRNLCDRPAAGCAQAAERIESLTRGLAVLPIVLALRITANRYHPLRAQLYFSDVKHNGCSKN